VRQVVCVRDITARKHAEEDYQTLFHGCAMASCCTSSSRRSRRPVDYRVRAVNPAFERMTGLDAERVVGRTVTAVLPGIEPAWIEVYGEVVRTGEPASFERGSAELTKHFHVTAFRPKANQFACLIRDVSDRMRAERARDARASCTRPRRWSRSGVRRRRPHFNNMLA
jgi:PAS domain S-box-containing protein